jgi:hypothetical protein
MTTPTIPDALRPAFKLWVELYTRALRARRDLPHIARAIDLPRCPVEIENIDRIEREMRREFERRA